MPIRLDRATNGSNSTGTTASFSHICSGTNRILFVGINIDSGDLVTSVTYNGVAMTLVDKTANSDSTTWNYLYYLLTPATATNTVAMTFSSSCTQRSVAVSYRGVKQTGQLDAKGIATATGTSVSRALTTIANNCWMVSFVGNEGQNPSAGAGSTQRAQTSVATIGDSNGVITPAGSYSMSWTSAASTHWGLVQASFSPAPEGGGAFLFNIT